jgi:hypothetical protein
MIHAAADCPIWQAFYPRAAAKASRHRVPARPPNSEHSNVSPHRPLQGLACKARRLRQPHTLPAALRLAYFIYRAAGKAFPPPPPFTLPPGGKPGTVSPSQDARAAARPHMHYVYVYGTAPLAAATPRAVTSLEAFPASQNPHRGRLPVLAGVHPWPPASEELRMAGVHPWPPASEELCNPHLRPTARFGRSSHLADWLRRRESLDFGYA